MAKIVWALHRNCDKLFAWNVPEGMQINEGDTLLVQHANGLYAKAKAHRILETSGPFPTGKVVRVIAPGEAVRELIVQRRGHLHGLALQQWQEKHRWKEAGLDIHPYLEKGFTDPAKLEQLRLALQMGMPVKQYDNPEWRLRRIRAARMTQMEALASRLGYIPEGCSREQIEQILLGVQSQVDTSLYASPKFGWRIMREVRLCLEAGMQPKPLKRLRHMGKQALEDARKEFLFDQAQQALSDINENAENEAQASKA